MKTKIWGLALFAATALTITSCSKAELDGDTVADGDLSVNYAVQVVPVGNVDKGLNGAIVTIQTQGSVKTATVGTDGIAVFENIKPGAVSGHVTAAGYATLNFTASINKTNVDANTTDFAASTIFMMATNSALAGRIYGDYNLDGNSQLSQAANFQAVDLYVSYGIGTYPMGSGNGALTSVSLDTDVYGITTGTDGRFNLGNLPNTSNGYFTASYWIQDVNLIDPVSGAQINYNIGNNGVALNPGVTTQVGDVLAN